MAGLGAAFLAGRHLGRGRRLGLDGTLRGRRLQAIFEIAELGFENEDARFEYPASGAVGNRRGRGVHACSMPESKGKRKIKCDGVNGYELPKTHEKWIPPKQERYVSVRIGVED